MPVSYFHMERNRRGGAVAASREEERKALDCGRMDGGEHNGLSHDHFMRGDSGVT